MVRKHLLALTYEPKVPDVRSGKCTQTIRQKSENKPKRVGDLVMFHGWEGRPYHSSWSWRTPYWKITESFEVVFFPKHMLVKSNKDNSLNHPYTAAGDEADDFAQLDGFKNYYYMYKAFQKMCGKKLWNKSFTLIRWSVEKSL